MSDMINLLGFIALIIAVVALREIGTLRSRVASLQKQLENLTSRVNAQGRAKAEVKPADRAAVPKAIDPVVGKPVAADAGAPIKAEATDNPWERPASPELTPPAKAAKALSPPRPKLDLETLLGAKGSVWIGGLALLFGAVFLLRYTIEAGLLTPMMRISMAVGMGGVALGLSEWMAQRDLKSAAAQALSAKADIPAILAAVGVFTLFGAAYAAHALYGLLGTMAAFIIMAAIALGAMALSLRRGPWLAAIGLVGALVVPLLVASVTPSYVGVFAYVAVITAAALWVAKRQAWVWLRAAALVGAAFWLTMLLGKAVDGLQFALWTAGLIIVTGLTVRDIWRAKDGPRLREWLMMAWAGIGLLTGLAMLAGDDWTPLSNALPFLFLLGLIAVTWRGTADRLWPLLPIGGALFAVIVCTWVLPASPEPAWPYMAALAVTALAFAVSILSAADRLTRGPGATILVLSGGGIAWIMLTAGIAQVSPAGSTLYLWCSFIIAGLFGMAALLQQRLAVVRGAILITALGWLVGTEFLDDILTVSLTLSAGLMVLIAVVFVSRAGRDDVWTRLAPIILAGGAGFVAMAVLENPATQISTTPFLNALWLYFGLPGGIAVAGAVLLKRRREDLASQALLGAGFVFGLLLFVLLIHHAMNGGDLTATPGFEDVAVQLLAPFAALFGASWMRGGMTDWPQARAEPWRYVVPALAMAASALSLLIFAGSQLLVLNPLLYSGTVIDGHPLFNSLMLGYLLPVLLLGGTALRVAGRRPAWFVRILAGLAGLAWLVWTTAQIRRFAQGETIAMGTVPWANGELYAVSAVWLLTGIALLLAGMKTDRRDLRLASAGLITLTTLKVFLIDMSALDGAFRAVSFIGLGIVLIGIGRLYQTVLMGAKNDEGTDTELA